MFPLYKQALRLFQSICLTTLPQSRRMTRCASLPMKHTSHSVHSKALIPNLKYPPNIPPHLALQYQPNRKRRHIRFLAMATRELHLILISGKQGLFSKETVKDNLQELMLLHKN